MTDPIQKQIDRTLTALNAVEPGHDMHARLLDALEPHEPVRPTAAVPRWWALPLAALLALAVALTLQHTRRHGSTSVATTTAPVSKLSAQQISKLPNSELKTEQNSQTTSLQSSKLTAEQNSLTASLWNSKRTTEQIQSHTATPKPQLARNTAPAPIHLEVGLTTDPEEQALADLCAPSHPAPRLPPTAQERLVLLMLRRGERHDLAQLDRAQQDVFAEQESDARQNFFDPPPSPALREALEHAQAAPAAASVAAPH